METRKVAVIAETLPSIAFMKPALEIVDTLTDRHLASEKFGGTALKVRHRTDPFN
ncbi:hypothetical protein AM571_PC00476 (plasmid) [Rhizobium etli 8C-3]|uniref:Uncharacterized protein n=1 Tax=Rhizobium etli 8C-3 TaxID=538025 RepID=A0A1L5PDJ6_RHIET|nr:MULTISPECIES: hypothetical protein [Rhizobium]APO78214.1 hypothetical protein AM571_PC00476 [Rhizobium etli 8C-3]